jgi:hypothetical protein
VERLQLSVVSGKEVADDNAHGAIFERVSSGVVVISRGLKGVAFL